MMAVWYNHIQVIVEPHLKQSAFIRTSMAFVLKHFVCKSYHGNILRSS